MRSLITDVPGVPVGNAHDARATDATVAILGGASRAASLLESEMTRGLIDAVVFSGVRFKGLPPPAWKSRFGGARL